MTDVPVDLHRRIAAALVRIERVTRMVGDRAAQDEGLSTLQARALEALVARPPRRVGELARELLVTQGTLSAALSSLAEKGLVVKRPDDAEHRAVRIEPTRKGRGVMRRLAAWPDAALAPVIADLGIHDAGAVLAALLAMIAAMERRGWLELTRMCPSCEFFRPWGGDGARPHYCGLLQAPIGGADYQVDCPEFVPADANECAARVEALRRPS